MIEPRPESAPRGWLRPLGNFVLGRFAWLIGAPMRVLGCGFLSMWWNPLQDGNSFAAIQALFTASAEARLVESRRVRRDKADAERTDDDPVADT
jgi:hypothetical protein